MKINESAFIEFFDKRRMLAKDYREATNLYETGLTTHSQYIKEINTLQEQYNIFEQEFFDTRNVSVDYMQGLCDAVEYNLKDLLDCA